MRNTRCKRIGLGFVIKGFTSIRTANNAKELSMSPRIVTSFALPVVCAAWLMAAAPAWAQTGPGEYSYTASGKVASGDRTLPMEIAGRVLAGDDAEAEKKARADVLVRITEEYPGCTLVADSLKISVRRVVADPMEDGHSRVRLSLRCLTSYLKEGETWLAIAGFPIIQDDDVVIDQFTVKVLVSLEGKEQKFEGRIRTIGRGKPGEGLLSFELWHGRTLEGEEPRLLEVKVQQKHPLEDKFLDVGTFRVRLKNEGGKLSVDWLPVHQAKVVGPTRKAPFHTTRLELSGEEFRYAAIMHADNSAEKKIALSALKKERTEKVEDLKKKLASAPAGVKVMTGGAEATAEGPGGRMSKVGVGRTFILSEKEAEARAFMEKNFPGRKDVLYARDEAAARAFLEKAFQEAHHREKIVPGSLTIRLAPKTGWTIADSINELKVKGPKRIVPKR